MNLIQYMLIPVGLSNANTTFDLIFRSITYWTFIMLGSVTLYSLPPFESCPRPISLAMKLSIILCLWSLYSSYQFVKIKIKELAEMFDEIQVVRHKRCHQGRCSLSLLLLLACYLTTLVMVFHDAFFNPASFHNFHNSLQEPIKLKLIVYQQDLVLVVLILYWYFIVQFVHYELSLKYYSYLSQSNKYINKFIAFKPNFVIRHQIHQVITDFEENREKWRQTVIPLKSIIFQSIVTLNVIIILQYLCNIEYSVSDVFNKLLVLFSFVLNFYSIVTQLFIYKMFSIEDILINTLTLWRDNIDSGYPLIVVIAKWNRQLEPD